MGQYKYAKGGKNQGRQNQGTAKRSDTSTEQESDKPSTMHFPQANFIPLALLGEKAGAKSRVARLCLYLAPYASHNLQHLRQQLLMLETIASKSRGREVQ